MDYYDSISAGYVELHKEEQMRKIGIVQEIIRIKPDSLVLDVGCGPGFTDWGASCIGIDPSMELLKKASYPVVQGIAEHLPFKDKSFDFVMSITALQNFNHPETGLTEIARVGKGLVCISFLKKSGLASGYETMFRNAFTLRDMVLEDTDMILFGNKI